ncbi:hypothetical protein F2Q68_00029347 [Brassica cretica]|uniref:tRNA/rRNA methyltransferase SpoU type domain-containing protein n=1 Tax=Brassica cretica TaxID=69181 RepID=A0A8S9GFU8_BRACR|nr:hypothetical protein F2Q68_00029347 [Brassica cretica]
MGSSVITSLSLSFKQVPPTAVPAFLDCVLSSIGVSPSSLFDSLIKELPFHTEEKKFDSDDCNHIASLVAGLCHLLKSSVFGNEDNHNALQLFVWRVFIPLMKMVRAYDLDMLNKIIQSFFDVVVETSALGILRVSLVPFLLRSVGVSMGMLQHEESDFIRWGELLLGGSLDINDKDENYVGSLSESFPIPLSCHLLNLILNAAFQSRQEAPEAEDFAAGLLWDLCNTTERLLSQSVEHRSCAVSFLLPAIFKALSSLKISLQGNVYILSRNGFKKRIWECCKKLFSVGSIERRDAYSVLSLCLSSDGALSYVSEKDPVDFDFRSDQEFWEEIKKGLVFDESLVRKQSLHILKSVLSISEVSKTSSEKKPEGNSVHRALTKKEMWAEKEAKSLGVGELYGSVESALTSQQQQWQAFVLLYEMLDEYGTHLVEAVWSNQIDLLIKSSFRYEETPDEETEIFNWLEVLWNRGFRHDNPLVRCTVMESFMGIEWRRYKTCTQSMSQTFVLGPFIEALNDSVHHKDFGLKRIYTSRTIEGAAQYVCAYTSCLNPRNRIGFLINLASLAKKQSFGRAGFMALVQCIVSTAYVVGGYGNKEMEHLENGFSGTPLEPSSEHLSQDEMSHILDVLKFVAESSRQHFNHKYRTREPSSEHLSQDEMSHILDVLKFVAESSRQHFNHKYRTRVCQKVLETAVSVVNPCEVPLGTLLQFVSAIPREFTDHNGSLRKTMLEWLQGCNRNTSDSLCTDGIRLVASLHEYLKEFVSDHVEGFDDEDLEAWESQTKRWARVFFLTVNDEEHLADIITFVQNSGVSFFQEKNHLERAPAKLLIFILSMLLELQNMQDGVSELSSSVKSKSCIGIVEENGKQIVGSASVINEKFAAVLLSILKQLVSFADSSCSIFWSHTTVENGVLSGSIIGKLGGPSQRRLSVPTTTAVLEAKLADLANMAEPACQNQDYQDAIVAGKLFLLELLDAAVHDKDLAKELYKKYSAIHRRKIRAWQMICIMSRFVSNDIVGQVMDSVHICLYRNNLPAVRQYLETFAINIYLKFPPLVKEQLVPILQNYDTKAQQALSSYVFIAANVILHAEKMAQQTNLRELLPPIIPLLTSHHHSLRGFTQLLVHRVLFRLFPPLESTSSQTIPLEKLSFENLKSYLDKNPDCSRKIVICSALLSHEIDMIRPNLSYTDDARSSLLIFAGVEIQTSRSWRDLKS